MRVAGFKAEADGPDGCISKCFPTPGTGILKSDLDVAVSVSMTLRENALVVENGKVKRSIQHDDPIGSRRDVLVETRTRKDHHRREDAHR